MKVALRILSNTLFHTLLIFITAAYWLVFVIPFLLIMNAKLIWHALTYGLQDPFDMWRVVKNDL